MNQGLPSFKCCCQIQLENCRNWPSMGCHMMRKNWNSESRFEGLGHSDDSFSWFLEPGWLQTSFVRGDRRWTDGQRGRQLRGRRGRRTSAWTYSFWLGTRCHGRLDCNFNVALASQSPNKTNCPAPWSLVWHQSLAMSVIPRDLLLQLTDVFS